MLFLMNKLFCKHPCTRSVFYNAFCIIVIQSTNHFFANFSELGAVAPTVLGDLRYSTKKLKTFILISIPPPSDGTNSNESFDYLYFLGRIDSRSQTTKHGEVSRKNLQVLDSILISVSSIF